MSLAARFVVTANCSRIKLAPTISAGPAQYRYQRQQPSVLQRLSEKSAVPPQGPLALVNTIVVIQGFQLVKGHHWAANRSLTRTTYGSSNIRCRWTRCKLNKDFRHFHDLIADHR